MKRSRAPSVLARKRHELLVALGREDELVKENLDLGNHNATALDVFLECVRKAAPSAAASSRGGYRSDDDTNNHDDDDENGGDDAGLTANSAAGARIFFGVRYGTRQSRRQVASGAGASEQNDGLLCIEGGKCILLDMSNKSAGRTTCKSIMKYVERDLPIMVGRWEIAVQERVEERDYVSGKFFIRGCAEKDASNLDDAVALHQQQKPKVAYTLAAARLRMTLGRFTCPLKFAPKEQRDPTEPLHSPYVEGAVVLFRANKGQRDSAGRPLVSVVVDPVLGVNLRPHQRRGVKFMFDCVCSLHNIRGSGCILADDMGLGKSLQAITITFTLLRQGINGMPTVRRACIVCPSSLVGNWVKEFGKWLGDAVTVKAVLKSGQTDKDLWDFDKGNYDVLVISYEQFMRNVAAINKLNIGFLICDEGHRLKNSEIKTTEALASIATPRRVILSGTPIQNDLEEFYSMCDFVNHGVLGDYTRFKRVFEAPILASREPYATVEEKELGEARSQELTRLTAQFILRRTNTILQKYLPPKLEYVVFCGLSEMQKTMYRLLCSSSEVRKLLSEADESRGTAASLAVITLLKKLCNHPKLIHDVMREGGSVPSELRKMFPKNYEKTFATADSGKAVVLENILAEMKAHTTDKIVVVSNYTQTLDMLSIMCDRRGFGYLRLDGSTPIAQRQPLVDKFNDSPQYLVFFLSSKAGGCGLNLVGANRLVLYDPDWNPASDLQAMARVWRDGQKKNVFIYRFLSTGTIEEKIYQRQVAKTGLSKSVLAVDEDEPSSSANDQTSAFSGDDLRDIFRLNETTLSDTHDLIRCGCSMTGDKYRPARGAAKAARLAAAARAAAKAKPRVNKKAAAAARRRQARLARTAAASSSGGDGDDDGDGDAGEGGEEGDEADGADDVTHAYEHNDIDERGSDSGSGRRSSASGSDDDDDDDDDDDEDGGGSMKSVQQQLAAFHHYRDIAAVSDMVLANAGGDVVTFAFVASADGVAVDTPAPAK